MELTDKIKEENRLRSFTLNEFKEIHDLATHLTRDNQYYSKYLHLLELMKKNTLKSLYKAEKQMIAIENYSFYNTFLTDQEYILKPGNVGWQRLSYLTFKDYLKHQVYFDLNFKEVSTECSRIKQFEEQIKSLQTRKNNLVITILSVMLSIVATYLTFGLIVFIREFGWLIWLWELLIIIYSVGGFVVVGIFYYYIFNEILYNLLSKINGENEKISDLEKSKKKSILRLKKIAEEYPVIASLNLGA